LQRILIADDDLVQLKLTSEVARKSGYEPLVAESGTAALRLLRSDRTIAALVLDLVMPDLDGFAVMEAMRREGITVPVIVQTASPSPETIVSAMRAGALDFFAKPVPPERMIVSLGNALRLTTLESEILSAETRRDGRLGLADIVTRAPAMHRILGLVEKCARGVLPILIEGEAGTGKNLIARVIHGRSDRAGRPFIIADAAHAHLIERIEAAEGGTLYLKHLGALSADGQRDLLQLLQHGTITRPGSVRPSRVNVRLIAASDERLLNRATAGQFREDLFYRLNVMPLYLPPLRDRREDIEPLAARIAARFAAESGKRLSGLSAAATGLLAAHDWPGNIAELETLIYRAVALSDSVRLEPADFPALVTRALGRATAARTMASASSPSAPVHIDAVKISHGEADIREVVPDRFMGEAGEVAPLESVERDLIAFALDRYEGRMSQIARALGIGRSTLYRKLREYDLEGAIQRDAA
jgi:DNA-binding NtrC family response regulator